MTTPNAAPTPDDVEARDQRRLQLISLTAHELAAPVSTVKGYLQLLDQGLAGPLARQQADIVAAALQSVARMEQMVGDLSDFAKLEAGRFDLHPAAFQLHTVVYEAVNLLFDRIEDKHLDVEMTVSSDLPPVFADRMRISQVITNLMSNAVKYNREGGKIFVRAQQKDGFIEMRVEDTGTGIAAEEQSRLFSAFFRSQDGFVRSQSGTGLGLVIAQQIVRQHGGEIGFTSQKDVGTTFFFSLPVAAASAAVP